MRVLLINQFYPPDTAATGQLLADVAAGLTAEGHEAHVLCSRGLYGGGDSRVQTPLDDAARCHRLGATALGRASTLGRLCDWTTFYALAACRSLRMGRFDACMALSTPPFIAALGLRMRRAWGTRLVLWSMDVWPDIAESLGALPSDGLPLRALRGLARRLYEGADAILSLGPTMTRRLCQAGAPPQKVVEVPNWVPGEAVSCRPRRHGESALPDGIGDGFVVMYSGNMGLPHEFDTFLDAAALMADDPGVSFVFVGGGKRRREIIESVRRRRLGNVRFLPSQPMDRLSDLLASADAHLVSLRREALGYVVPSKIYGVMAAGRPAVFVGPPDSEAAGMIRDSGGGFVASIGRGDAVADALRRLREDPWQAARMGAAARDYYASLLGRDRSVRRIIDVLVGGGNPP